MKVLLTGASGFVGSHVLRHLLVNTGWDIVAPVTFRHKGLPERIESAICTDPSWARRVEVPHWDLTTPPSFSVRKSVQNTDVIMNVASESHVDRSIGDPVPFIANNMSIILNMLELAREIRPKLFLQMSTDEVYGPAPGGYFHKEWDTPMPSNPYSASKAAQEAIGISYWRTYSVPLVITNTMNIIGEMQDPEKFLPMIMRRLSADRPVIAHVGPDGKPGSRFYLHARNLADAWLHLTRMYLEPEFEDLRRFDGRSERIRVTPEIPMYADGSSRPGRFHIVGEYEIDNVAMIDTIASAMGLATWEIKKTDFHSSRPGHDLRYALDGTRIRHTGWSPPVDLMASITRTVQWTLKHPEWLQI